MRVGIIGTGHVGIVSAVCLASLGHRVVGTDHDAAKIAMLKDGGAPFFEEGVSELLAGGLDGGALSFSTDPADAISGAQIVLISVGTPPRVTGEANLIAVEQAARTVAQHATGRCLVVEKSTVPTGSAGRLRQTLAREKLGSAELQVASNPEFLREGVAVAMNPDRILVGADSKWAFATMRELLRSPNRARGSVYRNQHRHRRTRQTRLRCFPRPQGLVRQCTCSGMRAVRRRCGRRHEGDGSRSAHRGDLSAGRYRLRRFLFLQGPPRFRTYDFAARL